MVCGTALSPPKSARGWGTLYHLPPSLNQNAPCLGHLNEMAAPQHRRPSACVLHFKPHLPERRTRMTTPSVPVPQPELAPPLAAIIQRLRNVTEGCKLRCCALVGNNTHCCDKCYEPWTQDIEPLIKVICNTKPPFSEEHATAISRVLLCEQHRHIKKHLTPLRLTLMASKASASKEWHDDSSLPRRTRNSLNPTTDVVPSRRSRAKSAEPDLETSSSLPERTGVVHFYDASSELQDQGNRIQCIAYDPVMGRCGRKLPSAIARSMFATLSGEEEGDEDEEYRGTDSEDEEQEGIESPLQHLWPFIHALLCNDHRHWFWLKFYYDEWQGHVACDDSAVGDSEFWSDSEPETAIADASHNNWSDSESVSDAEDFTGGYATPRADIYQSIEGDDGSSSSPIQPGTPAPTGLITTLYGLLSTPRRLMDALTWNTQSAPERLTRSWKEPEMQETKPTTSETGLLSPFEPSSPNIRIQSEGPETPTKVKTGRRMTTTNPCTPSISVSKAPMTPSPTPRPSDQRRRSLRITPRESNSPRQPCSPSPKENGDVVEDEDLVASMRKRDADASSSDSSESDSNSANATILTPGWSRSISEKLHDGILQSLGRKTTTGCIYIMRTPSHPGLIKIGKAKNPSKRRNEIENDCNLDDLRILHVWRDVPHHERAELLVHLQLRKFREILPCAHEGSDRAIDHKEWFRCEVSFAKRAVNVWVMWMEKDPYQNRALAPSWSSELGSILGPKGGREETFEDLFQRHKRWTEQ